MAPPVHPFPDRDALLAVAARHPSRASLADAFGWKPNSFRARLIREGWLEEVDAALRPGLEKQEAIDALKGVAELVR